MSQQPTRHPVRRGRIFPDHTIPLEELAKRKAERQERYQRCRQVFDKVRDELIAEHYNWFMSVEPNSGDYIIDPDEDVLMKKSRQRFPSCKLVIFQINETGACGMI
jgi:hypothetical protein